MPTAISIDRMSFPTGSCCDGMRHGRKGTGFRKGDATSFRNGIIPFRSVSGQAMIESVVSILAICLLLFGLLQLAHAFASREILRHAATRAARARTVGFNGWMVTKVMRTAAIPNAGRQSIPGRGAADPTLRQAVARLSPGEFWDWSLTAAPRMGPVRSEIARIPEYLASENSARASQLLDYERWDDIRGSGLGGGGMAGAPRTLHQVEVRQDYPLDIMVRALYDWVGALSPSLEDGSLRLRGRYSIESHYPLYLDDEGR